MGVLRTVAIIILIYYGLKFIGRFVLPFFAKTLINKAQQNMQDQFDRQQRQYQRSEGEVTINTKTNSKSAGSHEVDAEDVDFEEIKD